MAAKLTVREQMIMDLSNFVESQSRALSIEDLRRLIVNLPVLRERIAKIPRRTYSRLADQLEFLCLFVDEQVAKLSPGLDTDPIAEAAFALLYFQREIDLIPDPIPGIGLLDDAIIVDLVLRRQNHAFQVSPLASELPASITGIDVEQLLSVISPLRLTSFYSMTVGRRENQSLCY
jgi:uncharacterized membrane protein YkvA (DUF1232 family)